MNKIKVFICIFIIRIFLFIITYGYFIKVTTYSKSDITWFWMVWGVIDLPVIFLMSLGTFLLGFVQYTNTVLLILHLIIGTIYWFVMFMFFCKIFSFFKSIVIKIHLKYKK